MLTDEEAKEQLEVGIHWLAATIRDTTELDLDTALGFISEELEGADWTSYDGGANGYTKTYKTIFGLRLLVNEERPEMGIHMIADGDCCEALGARHLQKIYLGLHMHATRLDLAVDQCDFSPADLREYWYADQVRTACKPARNPFPGRETIRSCSWYSSPTGDTFNMGSRASSAFARCYNERGFTRFELEVKGQRAVKVAALVFEDVDQLARSAIGAIRDFVDFVDTAASANRSRCPLLPVWESFVGQAGRAGVKLEPRPKPTIERTVDWIEGQVARSLVLYETYVGTVFKMSKEKVHRRLRRIGLARTGPKDDAVLKMLDRSMAS